MSVATYKGTVENGKINLQINVKLPEKSEVYVVFPDLMAKFNLSEIAA